MADTPLAHTFSISAVCERNPVLTGAALICVTLLSLIVGWRVSRALRAKAGADVLTVLAAAMASSVAATGMWHFFSRTMHLPVWVQALLFAFMEISVLASALRARANVAREGTAGADGAAVWVLTCVSGLMSSSEAASPQEGLVRVGAPLVAAWLWERSLVPERRAQRERAKAAGRSADRALDQIKRTARNTVLAWLGVVDPDQSPSEIRKAGAREDAAQITNRIARMGWFLRPVRRARLRRRRDAAYRTCGATHDRAVRRQILSRAAALRHGNIEELTYVSPWAVELEILDQPATTLRAGTVSPLDRPISVRELPMILAASSLLVRPGGDPDPEPDPDPDPDPDDRPITARDLPAIYGTTILLASLAANRTAGPRCDTSHDGTPDPDGTSHHATADSGDTSHDDTPADAADIGGSVTPPRGSDIPGNSAVQEGLRPEVTLPVDDLEADVARVKELTAGDPAAWRGSKADSIRKIDRILPNRTSTQVEAVLAAFGVTTDDVTVRKTRSRDRQTTTAATPKPGDESADKESKAS